jgi:16S rRNA processing protein RimM
VNEELVIGRVRKPHGVHGELKVESLSGTTDHILNLTELVLVRGKERVTIGVASSRPAGAFVLIRPEGITSPEEAKRFRGWDLVAPRKDASELEDGEYYYADLVGLAVVVDGEQRGTVVNVLDGGPWPFLDVRVEDGTARVVPFQSHFTGAIDLEAGTIEVLDPEVLE